MIKKLLLLFVLTISTVLTAHEFWIEPQKFNLKRGETLKLNLKVGENFQGDNWNGTRASVNSLRLFYNEIEDDLSQLIPDDVAGDSLSLQFFDEGTGLISYQSTNKRIELEPDKFLEYLKEDGLTNAIEYREAHGENDSTGKEYYQRCVKTIFQVGVKHDDSYKTNCELPLEFIPLQHPYQIKKGQQLKFKLLLFKEPLKSALVKVWHKAKGKVNKDEFTTDEEGNIKFTPTLSGRYMVSAVTMQRIDTSSSTNWQSYWATLTWGY
jgi:uncharacterized GH25 family protein